MYDKQIDNLRTNHRGVYVLHDNSFRPVGRISGDGEEVQRRIRFVSSSSLPPLLEYPPVVASQAMPASAVTATLRTETDATGAARSSMLTRLSSALLRSLLLLHSSTLFRVVLSGVRWPTWE